MEFFHLLFVIELKEITFNQNHFINLSKNKDMSLDKQFTQAQADTKTLTKRPSDSQLLDLYAFFKQATEGDNNTSKPGMFDIKGKFKWEAWKAKAGLSAAEAQQKYVDLVNGLLETHK